MHLKKHRRRGFTLVELLVVLAIIAVLAALTTAAVMRFTGAGIAGATRANLGKAQAKLNDQWKGVTDGANKDSLSHPANSAYATVALGGGSNLADASVRQRYVQLRQIQAFPMSFYEVFWPLDGKVQTTAPNAWKGYVDYLAELGVRPDNEAAWSTISLDVQQSICLLMIFQKGPKNTGVSGDELGSAVGPVTLGTGFGKARGIVDGWHRPVMFTRQYQGKDATIAVLSAGRDGRFGVDGNPRATPPTTLTVATPLDASDNIQVPAP